MASRRVRIVVWLAISFAVVAIVATAGIAFVVLRTVNSTPATAASAAESFGEIRKLYPGRAPLIEIRNMQRGEFQINRAPAAPRKKVETIHFAFWDHEDQKLVRGEAPIWITQVRVSLTGVGNWSFSDFHVTREDIERYSPGILMDFAPPGGGHVLVWTR